ncbi:hypothetical protein, partial [Pseudophaeobacter leonis]|uniref:hypothetical protein n=1 Tax=Pseudophaeobacter leonis TaxID=1144477 RepID=UPI0019D3E68E
MPRLIRSAVQVRAMDLRSLCCALQLGPGTAQILLHGHQIQTQQLPISEQICDPPNRPSQSSDQEKKWKVSRKERKDPQNPERHQVTPIMQCRYSSA